MRALAILLGLLVASPLYAATSADAVICDGVDDLGTFSTLGEQWRTQDGVDIVLCYFTNIDTADGGAHWVSKRASNDADNHYLGATVAPALTMGYQGTDTITLTGFSVDTWYAPCAFYDKDTDTWTYWGHTNGGTLVDSDTFTPTTSNADDGQEQEVSICGVEIGGVVGADADLLSTFWTFIADTNLSFSITDADNFATDPINTQNAWLTTYGAGVKLMINEVRTDISGNSETLTLIGNAAWGTGNGPSVPDESVSAGGVPLGGPFRGPF